MKRLAVALLLIVAGATVLSASTRMLVVYYWRLQGERGSVVLLQ